MRLGSWFHRGGSGWGKQIALVTVGVIWLVTGCGSASSSPATAQGPGGPLVVRVPADWDTLNPQIAYGFNSGEIDIAPYDRLVSWDPVHSTYIPYVATSWTIGSGSIVFTIKQGITCSDGTPLTTGAIANSFNALFAAASSATIRSFGAPPLTMAATDATHDTFTWTSGLAGEDLLYGFANYSAGIICPAGLVKGADFETKSFGSGPWVLQSAMHGQGVTFVARKGWIWGPNGAKSSDPGFPTTLTYQVVGNPTTAANELTTGGLDITNVAGADLARLLAEPGVSHITLASNAVQTLAFNETPGHPTDDPILRQALMMSVSGKAYNTAEYNGYGINSTSIVTPTTPCFASQTATLLPAQNIAAAKTLLQSNGYTYSGSKLMKDGKQISMSVPGEPSQGSGPEYLQAQFSQLGINVSAPVLDFNSWNADEFTGKWDAVEVEFNFAAPPQAWIPFMSGPLPLKGVNVDYTVNPTVDQAVSTFRSTSGTTRCQALMTMQTSLLMNFDLYPLVAEKAYWFSKGWTYSLYFLYGPDPTSFRKSG